MNDLSRGACPAVDVKCLVVDEAHKATGNHAYCQVRCIYFINSLECLKLFTLKKHNILNYEILHAVNAYQPIASLLLKGALENRLHMCLFEHVWLKGWKLCVLKRMNTL